MRRVTYIGMPVATNQFSFIKVQRFQNESFINTSNAVVALILRVKTLALILNGMNDILGFTINGGFSIMKNNLFILNQSVT